MRRPLLLLVLAAACVERDVSGDDSTGATAGTSAEATTATTATDPTSPTTAPTSDPTSPVTDPPGATDGTTGGLDNPSMAIRSSRVPTMPSVTRVNV